jgi:hypothetical protein
MMDTLQLIYGLCNIYLTFGAFVERSGWNWTEGELWMGPYQFLFDGERFTGEERIWYNPDFDKETWDRHPPDMNRVVTIIPRVREALNKLETHAFGDTLIESIRLMQDGFATRDGSYRLLRYWSALERLYLQKGEIDGSKELIQRATFADRDSDIFRWKLVHISKLRNDYVHSGGRKGDIQPMCQFMRHLLERHINYWIFSSDDLSSHSEMLDFVKLPRDQATLESRMRIIERRLSMLNG